MYGKPKAKSSKWKEKPCDYFEEITCYFREDKRECSPTCYVKRSYEQGKKDFAKKVLEEYNKPIFDRKCGTLKEFVEKELSR